MASLNTLRTKFGIVLSIIIALALLAFILSLKTEMGFSGNDPRVGVIDGKKMGVIGQIHPLVAETYGIGGEVYVADLDFTTIEASLAEERVFHSLPRFPAVTRDLALVCDEGITIGQLEACIRKAGGALLRKIDLFDIYRGTGIAEGKKSVAFSLELRADDRTLTDDDSIGTVQRILDALQKELGAVLR